MARFHTALQSPASLVLLHLTYDRDVLQALGCEHSAERAGGLDRTVVDAPGHPCAACQLQSTGGSKELALLWLAGCVLLIAEEG